MEQQEIQERNKQIALMLGWKITDGIISYIPEESSFQHEVGYSASGFLQFDSDWNWLMEAVEFIKKNIKVSSGDNTKDAKIGEFFIDEWNFKVKSYYLRVIQWTENGWRMMLNRNENYELSMLYIIGENCDSEKEATFLITSDFAKLYNEKKL
jgi:hypothetical protein